MSAFLDPLELEYVDGKVWTLTSEFDYHLGAPDGPEAVHVPVGFQTDFASIPRPLWSVWPPTGRYGKAAVIHDWLYQYRAVACGNAIRLVERGEADHILLEAMDVLGVGWFTRWLIYAGVRAGGGVVWAHYRNQEAASV